MVSWDCCIDYLRLRDSGKYTSPNYNNNKLDKRILSYELINKTKHGKLLNIKA
jgi:hypothetical protein